MGIRSIAGSLGSFARRFLMTCGLVFLRLCAVLPVHVQQTAGRGLGRLAYRFYPYRKDVALTNVKLCFPELSKKEREELVYDHFEAMGIGLFEVGMAWWGSVDQIRRIGRIEGLEHLEKLRAEGRGALLLSAHFTTLEIIGRIVSSVFPISILYRNPNDPTLAEYMAKVRDTGTERAIHFDDMVGLVRALREGDLVWYAPDQAKLFKYTAILPFFGEPAVTNTATSRIAKMSKAAIVPFFGWRDPDGSYRVRISPPLEGLTGESPEADARTINGILEGFVRIAPEQYFWLHKRFKNRGPSYPDPYAQAK